MIEENTPDKNQEFLLPNKEVAQSFDRFQVGDQALIPHRNRYARWMFLHIWLVPLVLLMLTILFCAAAVIGVEDQRVIGTMIRVYGPRLNSPDCVRSSGSFDGILYGQLECLVTVKDKWREENRYRSIERVKLEEAVAPTVDNLGALDLESESDTAWLYVIIFYTSREWTSFVMSVMTIFLGIPLLLSLVVVGLLISMLARKVPEGLAGLAYAGRLQPGRDLAQTNTKEPGEDGGLPANSRWLWPRAWWCYANDLDRAVVHPIRFAFFIFWFITIFYFAWGAVVEMGATKTDVIWSTVYGVVVILFGSVGFGYMLSFILWYLFVIAVYLRNITPIFKLDIQPEHGDGCGGLQRLGQISLIIALVIVIPTLVITLLWWTGVLTIVTNLFIGSLVALSFLLIMAPLAFFGPLWRVHTEMSAAKARYQDDAIANIAPIEQRVRERIIQGLMDEEDTQKLDRELTRLKMLYPATHKYPTWPYSPRQLFTFLSSQLIAFISIIISVIEFGEFLGERFIN